MSRKHSICLLLLSIPAFTPVAYADWTMISKTSQTNAIDETETLMVKGKRLRTESSSAPGTFAIFQFDLNRVIEVDTREKSYTTAAIDEIPNAMERSRLAKLAWGGKVLTPEERAAHKRRGTITYITEIQDTEERRQFFGHQARHLKIHRYTHTSADACRQPDDEEEFTDAWEIDLPHDFDSLGQYIFPHASLWSAVFRDFGGCEDRIQERVIGKDRHGLVVLQDTVIRQRGKSSPEQTRHYEVLELSSDTLESSLFDAPVGFRFSESREPEEATVSEESSGLVYKYGDILTPLSLGITPITGDSLVQRHLRLDELRSEMKDQFQRLKIAPVDIDSTDLPTALKIAATHHIEFLLVPTVGSAEVPDNENDKRPPYGSGIIECKIYDVATGRQVLWKAIGGSERMMTEAARRVANNTFGIIGQERERRATAAGYSRFICIAVYPIGGQLGGGDSETVRGQIIQELKLHYNKVFAFGAPGNGDFTADAASHHCTWYVTAEWRQKQSGGELQYTLVAVPAIELPRATREQLGLGSHSFTGVVQGSSLVDSASKAAEAIAKQIAATIESL